MAIDAASNMIRIEVAYALPDKQLIIPLEVEMGCTALMAVHRSGIAHTFPEIEPDTADIGIWSKVLAGKHAPAVQVLAEGDRVEIYRPLQMDPMESRRLRAEKARKKRLLHRQ